MSREDQVNPISYDIIIISSKNALFKNQYLWNLHAQAVSTASTGSYPILVLRSSPFKVGGTVTTTSNDPPPWVLRQSNMEPSWGQLATPYHVQPIVPL
ncbi:hypothetical protein O181_047620 [Austropuccinia psidii MF-1]|uniref:Uncharacterized protein n=1 Tax=Austropuccinia psidii MF-1 TaxID=1389203 RepID=A0A9Q3DVM0_9BASI|nr:hypothetical protein [Austropuccinia psidii MF-1]